MIIIFPTFNLFYLIGLIFGLEIIFHLLALIFSILPPFHRYLAEKDVLARNDLLTPIPYLALFFYRMITENRYRPGHLHFLFWPNVAMLRNPSFINRAGKFYLVLRFLIYCLYFLNLAVILFSNLGYQIIRIFLP